MNLRYWLSLLGLVVACGCAGAQPTDSVYERIARQRHVFPQEKVCLVTDHERYEPGSRIWLQAYVADAASHAPVGQSRYVYVELIDSASVVVSRVQLRSADGIFSGYVDIPDFANPGRYCLRAYTASSASLTGYESLTPVSIGQDRWPALDPSGRQVLSLPRRRLTAELRGRRLVVCVDVDEPVGPLRLLAHCRAVPYCLKPVEPHQTLSLRAADIPAGVSQLLLIDDSLRVLAEDLVYIDAEPMELQVETARTSADSVRVSLRLPRHAQGSVASVCAAVDTSARRQSVMSDLLLRSDLNYPTPALRPRPRSPQERFLLSRLLHCSSWTRYDMAEVLAGHLTARPVEPQTAQRVAGTVVNTNGGREAGAQVGLVSPQAGLYAVAQTDLNGRYEFDGLQFAQGTQLVIQAEGVSEDRHVRVRVDDDVFPPLLSSVAPLWQNPFGESFRTDSSFDGRQVELGDVVVKARRERAAPDVRDAMPMAADASFSLRFIEGINATCLHELLRRIPGLRLDGERVYVRATTSIFGDNPAAVAIDGVLMERDFDLDEVMMPDVERIDVYRTGATAIWGHRGGSGVVAVTTKGGNFMSRRRPNHDVRTCMPLGFQRPQAYVPASRTAFWVPDVRLDGLRTVELTLPCAVGCVLHLRGITDGGAVIEQDVRLP